MVGTRGATRSLDDDEMTTQHGERSTILKCEYCYTPFMTKADLDSHVDLLHTGPFRKFSCMHCGDMYTSRQGLKQHVQKKHTGQKKKPICPECNKVCASEAWLNNHIKKMHTYACVHCDEIYKKRWHLNVHVAGVHQVCPYRCDFCDDKHFASNEACKKHTRIVHILELGAAYGEKPYVHKCKLSDRVAKKSRHGRSLRRPYECEVCDKAFAHRTGLVAHMERRHAEDESDQEDLPPRKVQRMEPLASLVKDSNIFTTEEDEQSLELGDSEGKIIVMAGSESDDNEQETKVDCEKVSECKAEGNSEAADVPSDAAANSSGDAAEDAPRQTAGDGQAADARADDSLTNALTDAPSGSFAPADSGLDAWTAVGDGGNMATDIPADLPPAVDSGTA